MPRVSVVVDKNELISAINKVEENGPLATQSDLYTQVAAEMRETFKRFDVTPSVVMLRIKEWAISVKTEPARKVVRKTKDVIQKRNPLVKAGGTIDKKKTSVSITVPRVTVTNGVINEIELRSSFPASAQGLVDKSLQGDLRAAIALNCLDCAGMNKETVRTCHITNCPLWLFRPFKDRTEPFDQEYA